MQTKKPPCLFGGAAFPLFTVMNPKTMRTPKEKRTKEQVLRLLDRAIKQEETLLERIKTLESALLDCRHKMENPRHEVEELALPASKVSFRLDFYRTGKKGPFKGLIEHLSTRESRTFEGHRFSELEEFVVQFIGSYPLDDKRLAIDLQKSTGNIAKEKKGPASPQTSVPQHELVPAPRTAKPVVAEPVQKLSPPKDPAFLILVKGVEKHRRVVRIGQSFQIEIPLQQLADFKGLPCMIKIQAASLEKRLGEIIQLVEYYTPQEEKCRIDIHSFPLKQGVYQLTVTIQRQEERCDAAFFHEHRLLLVQ